MSKKHGKARRATKRRFVGRRPQPEKSLYDQLLEHIGDLLFPIAHRVVDRLIKRSSVGKPFQFALQWAEDAWYLDPHREKLDKIRRMR